MASKIKAIIVDDEPLACKRIKKLLSEDKDVDIVAICENGKQAIEEIHNKEPDLLFLDIQMPEISGFDVLNNINDDIMPAIIFVTAYDEYAIKAFEVHALDYLMKPFKKERFQESLERAKTTLAQGDQNSLDTKIENLLQYLDPKHQPLTRLLVKSSDQYFFLDEDDVDWIESEGNYVRIHTKKKDYLIRETMKNMEKKLNPDLFFRIHRSTIINVEKVKELEPWFHGDYKVTMYNGKKLTMSRNYKELMKRYN